MHEDRGGNTYIPATMLFDIANAHIKQRSRTVLHKCNNKMRSIPKKTSIAATHGDHNMERQVCNVRW